MKVNKKSFYLSILLTVMLTVSLLSFPARAAELGMRYAENIGLSSAGDEDIRDTAVDIIRYLITFLGIIAVAIILYGGFIWLTASGNEDRVSKAKRIIGAGVIGLVIVLAAFAIVTFIIEVTQNAINGEFG